MNKYQVYRQKVEKLFEDPQMCGLEVLNILGYTTCCLPDLTIAELNNDAQHLQKLVDTWLEKYKDEIVFITELCIVLNHKSWDWSEKKTEQATKFTKAYIKLYNQVKEYTYKHFNKADQKYFWNMTD